MTQPIFDAGTCEQIFHAALAAGDIKGVEAALTVMAPQDPHRAQELLDMVRVGLALADGRRPTSDTPAVIGRRLGTSPVRSRFRDCPRKDNDHGQGHSESPRPPLGPPLRHLGWRVRDGPRLAVQLRPP